MAEAMSTTHVPDERFLKAYGNWADGGWGMMLTGMSTNYPIYSEKPGTMDLIQLQWILPGVPD